MFTLVMIAFLAGEEPIVRASPDLYRSYSECEDTAIDVMNMLIDELPPKTIRQSRIVYICADVPEVA